MSVLNDNPRSRNEMYPDPSTKSVKRVMTISVGHGAMVQRTPGRNQGHKKVRPWGVNFTPHPL